MSNPNERVIRSKKGRKVLISEGNLKSRGNTYPVDRLRWKDAEGEWKGTNVIRYPDQPERAEELARQIAKELDNKRGLSLTPSQAREFWSAQDQLKEFGEKIPVDVAVARYIAWKRSEHSEQVEEIKGALEKMR